MRAETCVVAFTCKWLDNDVDNVDVNVAVYVDVDVNVKKLITGDM